MTQAPRVLDLTTRLAGGTRLPLIGLGTWRLRGPTAREAVGWALEAGYRHLDTATAYGNEADIGRALADSGRDRGEVFVTTKLPAENAGRERETLEESLRALRTDHVDLWLIHWPPPGDEAGVALWRELVRARDDGLARAIGVSNYSFAQLDELTAATGATPEVNQIRWSPFLFVAALVAGHRERGVVLEGYSPFRAGRLDHPVLTRIAERHGATTAQVVIRWHLQRDTVVIPKSGRRERIVGNVDVAGLQLADDELASIDALGGSARAR